MSRESFSKKYPDLVQFLDDMLEEVSEGEEFILNRQQFLIVTQHGEFEGGQILFRWNGREFLPFVTDTVIDFQTAPRSPENSDDDGEKSRTSDKDAETLYQYQLTQVGNFSSKNGPSRGVLACVWAVRHLAKTALGRWITRTDNTAVFASELKECFANVVFDEPDLPAGSIVISPTKYSNANKLNRVGHVGILGPHAPAGQRLIYSNSSRRALWVQSHTLTEWGNYYEAQKGLEVLFFPIPSAGKADIFMPFNS